MDQEFVIDARNLGIFQILHPRRVEGPVPTLTNGQAVTAGV